MVLFESGQLSQQIDISFFMSVLLRHNIVEVAVQQRASTILWWDLSKMSKKQKNVNFIHNVKLWENIIVLWLTDGWEKTKKLADSWHSSTRILTLLVAFYCLEKMSQKAHPKMLVAANNK